MPITIAIIQDQLEDVKKLIVPLKDKTGYKYNNTFKPKDDSFEERYNKLLDSYKKLLLTLDGIENPDSYKEEYRKQVRESYNCIKNIHTLDEPLTWINIAIYLYKTRPYKLTRDGYQYLFLDLMFLYKLENEEIIFEIIEESEENSPLGSGEKEIES